MNRRLAVAVLALALGAVGCGATPSPSDSISPDGFPTEVLGMPVLSVGGANQLIADGKLNGRVAAVGGWWIATMPLSCPAPGRWFAQLETYCQTNIFASRPFAAFACSSDGSSCGSAGPPPDTAILSPIIAMEASDGHGLWRAAGADLHGTGTPMVLIGHAGDARLWTCPAETRQDCAAKFVVDRIAWVNGQNLPLTGPDHQVDTRLAPDEVALLADPAAPSIVADDIRASDSGTIDPRLHGTGQSVVWLVRTVALDGADAEDPTRAAEVRLIDDTTGNLLEHHPLAIDPAAQPAFLRFQATTSEECCTATRYPIYRVEAADGQGVAETATSGWESGTDLGVTRWGAGAPVLLDAGDYVVHAWLGSVGNDLPGERRNECRTTVSVVAGQDTRLEAAFPASGACSFVSPTFADSMF